MKKITTRGKLLSVLAILACVQVCAAGENEGGIKIRGKEIGLKVGDRIPDFEAADQTGKTRKFKNLCGSKGLLFVIYRSASW